MLPALFFGCEFSSDINSDAPAKFEYPLKIGNSWEYERTFELFNFRPDSLKNTFPATEYFSRSLVEVKKDTTLQDSLDCMVVQEKLTEDHNEFLSWGYFANKPDGLFEYAYKNGGGGLTMPKQRNAAEYTIAGMSFRNLRDASDYFAKHLPKSTTLNDTLIYRDPQRKVLVYPFQIGEEWILHQGSPFTIHKKIVGTESVSTDAGNYKCYKIQWIYSGDFRDTIIFNDFICEKGLIKRSIQFKDIIASANDNPDGTGYVDGKDETILTDINF
jgi:hypothetical protein